MFYKVFYNLSFVIIFFLYQTGLMLAQTPLPEDCLKDRLYCSTSYVEKKLIEQRFRPVIRINLYAVLSGEQWDSPDQIVKRFIDFSSWQEYAQYDGTGNVRIKKCLELSPLREGDLEIHRQYLHFEVKAPAPLYYVASRMVGHYWLEKPRSGMLLTAKFEHQTKGRYDIEGEAPLIGLEGLKYNQGEFHLKIDAMTGDYYLYFVAWVIPEMDFLLSFVANYVEAGYLSIFRGMFEL